ncbi:MAG: lamin tail domain-containing protein, partial [Candidatus Poribacteria bacterium]|nr:lamin tail domain-containing protein [Candidatus Poribacteria bacterium]
NTKQGETEWIELFNPNPQVVDLSGWQITDASNKAIHLPVAVTIQPNGYLILSQKATAVQTSFAALNPSLIVELALPSLNNGGDTVTLKDRYQRQIDTVVYETSKSSRSMERVSVLEGVLQPSIDLDGGTPGKLNSLSQQISGQVELIIEPSPFDPLQHSTRIRYQAPFEAIITLQLFDAAGRKVRLLVDRQLAGGRQSIAWDGKNDAQEIVTVGIYICQIIAIVSSDKPAIRMAKPVIVAKQL